MKLTAEVHDVPLQLSDYEVWKENLNCRVLKQVVIVRTMTKSVKQMETML